MKEPNIVGTDRLTGQILYRIPFNQAPFTKLAAIVNGQMQPRPGPSSDPLAIACRKAYAHLLLSEGP